MTRKFQGYGEPTPFSNWLRALPNELSSKNISNQNMDYIWHHYRENWFITIEEKRFGGKQSFAQRQTHSMVVTLLTKASGDFVELPNKKVVMMDYRGHYLIQFHQTTPDDSDWILFNGTKFNQPDANEALSFILHNGYHQLVPAYVNVEKPHKLITLKKYALALYNHLWDIGETL